MEKVAFSDIEALDQFQNASEYTRVDKLIEVHVIFFSSVLVLDGAACSIHSYCSVLHAWALRAEQSSSSVHRMILQSVFTIFLLLQTDFWVEGREWQVPQNTPCLMALCGLCF